MILMVLGGIVDVICVFDKIPIFQMFFSHPLHLLVVVDVVLLHEYWYHDYYYYYDSTDPDFDDEMIDADDVAAATPSVQQSS